MEKKQRWWIIGSIVIIIYTALPVLWIISLSPGRSEVALTPTGVRIAGSF